MRRVIATFLGAAVVVSVGGCSTMRDVKHVAEGVKNLGKDTQEYEAKFNQAKTLTFSATYEVRSANGSPSIITLTQKPPRASYRQGDTQLIDDGTNVTSCNNRSGKDECSIVGPHTADGVFGASTFTFAFAPTAFLTLFRVLAISPEVSRKKNTRDIAGQASDCESLTKNRGKDKGERLEVCVTKDGVFSLYDVGDGDVVTLTRYTKQADDSAFTPPVKPTAT